MVLPAHAWLRLECIMDRAVIGLAQGQGLTMDKGAVLCASLTAAMHGAAACAACSCGSTLML